MTTATALSIVIRHVEDAAEGGRTCRACGRPWPCDVRQLVDAIAAEARALSGPPRPWMNGHGRSRTVITRSRSRVRPAVARAPIA